MNSTNFSSSYSIYTHRSNGSDFAAPVDAATESTQLAPNLSIDCITSIARVFDCKELVLYIAKEFPFYQDALSFLSTKSELRHLVEVHRLQVKPRLQFTACDLFVFNKAKFDFALANNFKLKIKVETDMEVYKALSFISNPRNSFFIDHLEAIHFENVELSNEERIESLLKQMGSTCLSLTSFCCEDIENERSLMLPEGFCNLIDFSCEDVCSLATLTCPIACNNLRYFSCGNVGVKAIVSCPVESNNLRSLSLGDIAEEAMVMLPAKLDNLEYIAFGKIELSAQVTFPEALPKLRRIEFKKEGIKNPEALEVLEQFQEAIDNC